MIPAWQNDIHFCVTHQLPSTLDGKHIFGAMYPLCQYKHGTWFKHKGTETVVTATEQAELVSCALCSVLLGAHDAVSK